MSFLKIWYSDKGNMLIMPMNMVLTCFDLYYFLVDSKEYVKCF